MLGATGRTGSLLVLRALESNIAVVALVKDPKKLFRVLGRPLTFKESQLLTVVQGDPTNGDHVEKAVEGVDAVYETIGRSLETRTYAQSAFKFARSAVASVHVGARHFARIMVNNF